MARQWSARCYGVARQREGSRPNSIGGLGRAFSPAFRAGSLYPLIPWRVGAEEAGAAKFGSMDSAGEISLFVTPYTSGRWVFLNLSAGAMLLDRLGPPGRCSGCWPHDGEVAGGAVADLV